MKKATLCFFLIAPMRVLSDTPFIGVEYAKISMYPHSGLLVGYCGVVYSCGSSVLNQIVLLSAAHCMEGCKLNSKSKHSVEVYLGEANFEHMKIKREVAQIMMHVDYDDYTFANDIALVKVRRIIPFGPNVKRVAISRTFPDLSVDSEGYMAGWGDVVYGHEEQERSPILKYVYQRIRNKEVCSNIDNMCKGIFCAGNLKRNTKHVTVGDSGSALVIKNKLFLQVGIVSYNHYDAPAITFYTNVSYFYSWIDRNAKILYCGLKKT